MMTVLIVLIPIAALVGYTIAALRAKADSAAVCSQLQSTAEVLTHRNDKLLELEGELRAERDSRKAADLEVAVLKATLKSEQESVARQLEALHNAETSLKDAFASLASDALKSNNADFLTLAHEKLVQHTNSAAAELERRKEDVQNLTSPINEALTKLQLQLHSLETKREGAYAGIAEKLANMVTAERDLKAETSRLVSALRAPQQRGRWGEIQLKNILELAGMAEHCDFDEQKTFFDDAGRSRLDVVVNLPAGRQLIIDSKVVLPPDLDPSVTDSQKQEAGEQYAAQVRAHVTQLGKKAYWSHLKCTPEFVIGFMHDEGCLSMAMKYDPELFEFAKQQGVILASPTILLALLRAVEYGWRQEKLAQNARDISQLGQVLYERIAGLYVHFGGLRKNLEGSVDSFNKLVGSLESRVMVSARKLHELGATGDEALETMEPIELSPREPVDYRTPPQAALPIRLERIVAVGQVSEKLEVP